MRILDPPGRSHNPGNGRPRGLPVDEETIVTIPEHALRASLALAFALVATAAPAQTGPLDGRRFDAQAGYVGKPAHVPKDIISFDGGRLHSSDCDQYGYDKGAYRATPQGDGIAFEAETVSAEYGRNTWKGVVRGDAIEGTFVFHRKATWWRPNPEPLEHWFRGKAVK